MVSSPKSILLITGMHRSNTSFLAKSFQDAGLNIGDQLIAADPYNKEGHFEDEDFVNFHRHLIKKYRLQSRYSMIDYKRCMRLHIDQSDISRAKQIITERIKHNEPFGWKDPRSCHFLNLWKRLIPELKCVFIIRDPHDTVNSIVRRHKDRSKIKLRPDLWYRYHRFWQVCNLQILDHLLKRPQQSLVIHTPEDIIDDRAQQRINSTLRDQWQIKIDPLRLKKNYRPELITHNDQVSSSKKNTKSLELYEKIKSLREVN